MAREVPQQQRESCLRESHRHLATPESSLDFQFNWDVTDNFSVSFDAVNITQDMQQSYYHFADVGTPTLTNFGTTLISRQFAIGARWRL